ncbi:MAG TPA: response regulator, partial [Ktedonobacterales bacterium]
IVDDDAPIRKVLTEVLSMEGYPIETATNGQEALDILARSSRSLIVLLDITMPVKSGREVMIELNARPSDRAKHKILFVSAIDRLAANRDVKADGEIAKPFDMAKLLDKLAAVAGAMS